VNSLLDQWSSSRFVLALFAGCAFPLAFAPFGWWPAGILCLMGLLFLLENAGRKQGIWYFYLFAVGMYGTGNWWIYHSIHVYGGAPPVLAFSMMALLVPGWSLHSALHGYLYMRFIHGRPLAVLVGFPLAWVLQEWVRTWFLTGFPWFFLGYSHTDTWLAGYAPVTGVLGVSLVAAFTACVLYSFLVKKISFRIGIGVIGLIWISGWMGRQMDFVIPTGERLSVSLIQGNVDQAVKWRRENIVPLLRLYRDMSESELGRDLIVWPEAAITLRKENAAWYLDEVSEAARQKGSTIVLGIPDHNPETGRYLNTAIALGEGSGQYIKRRLVPFGEYVPLESWLRGLIQAFDLPMSRNESGPDEQPGLMAGKYRVSMSICYEIIYPELVRNSIENPDLLMTISNDSWFGDSTGPRQHMQMARMRALELGRYLIRGTNNGVTAIVNQKGETEVSAPSFEQTILRGEVEIMKGLTPYAYVGNGLFLGFCLCGVGVLWYTRRGTRG